MREQCTERAQHSLSRRRGAPAKLDFSQLFCSAQSFSRHTRRSRRLRPAIVVVVADSSRKYNAISFQFNSRLKLQTSLRQDKVWWKRARSQPLNWNKNANLGAKKGSSPDAGREARCCDRIMCADREKFVPGSTSNGGSLSSSTFKLRVLPCIKWTRAGLRDKGKNGDGKVNNSQVAISLAASFLCFSESERERAGRRVSRRTEEERVRRERRRGRERKSVRYEGEKPRRLRRK